MSPCCSDERQGDSSLTVALLAAQERKNQTELQTERFMKPNAHTVTDPSKANFDAIGDDGMPIRGKWVKQGDVLIGKSITLNTGADRVAKFNDVSHKVELGGAGVVDDVRVAINGDGFKFCKVRVRSTRVPEIGDKVQSRHAQKGCVFSDWIYLRAIKNMTASDSSVYD